MFLITGKEMAEIDKKAIEQWGIPQSVLMENAGTKVVEEIKAHYQESKQELKGKKITILAGKGHNGGDGLVIARHLLNQGADIKVFLLGDKEFTGASLTNYNICQKLPISFEKIENENSLHLLKLTLHYTDILVDAIFGTGLQGEIQGMTKKVIETVNDYNCLKISVDLPSGLDANTGKSLGTCIKADKTVTFVLPKLALMVEPGRSLAGEVKVADIGIPYQLMEEIKLNKLMLTKENIHKYLPRRKTQSHKGNYGHLLVLGGSIGMMGAPYLASSGGFSLGAGMVTAIVPQSIQQSVAMALPEAMVYPATETQEGTLGLISGPEILKRVKGKTAVVFGPGMGFNKETTPLLKWLINQKQLKDLPLIIDADGLNALAQDLEMLKDAKPTIIITPHPGEMARLLKISIKEVQENRIGHCSTLAKKWGIWVVLKGNETIIATPKGQIFINPTGSPALATAGSGDILAGMIGAMAGQSIELGHGICTAVYIHGLAGQLVSQEIGEISSKAGDILGAISRVIKKEFS